MQQNWGLLKTVGLSSLRCHLLLNSEFRELFLPMEITSLQFVSDSERIKDLFFQKESVCVGFGFVFLMLLVFAGFFLR